MLNPVPLEMDEAVVSRAIADCRSMRASRDHSSRGSSLGGALEGNLDPNFCVVSRAGSY